MRVDDCDICDRWCFKPLWFQPRKVLHVVARKITLALTCCPHPKTSFCSCFNLLRCTYLRGAIGNRLFSSDYLNDKFLLLTSWTQYRERDLIDGVQSAQSGAVVRRYDPWQIAATISIWMDSKKGLELITIIALLLHGQKEGKRFNHRTKVSGLIGINTLSAFHGPCT